MNITVTVDAARTRVTELQRLHTEAKHKLQLAVDDPHGEYDFALLKKRVSGYAHNLELAESDLAAATERDQRQKEQRQRQRWSEVVQELRHARHDVAQHYRAAAVALGRWYELGTEASELAKSLAARLGDGTIYYEPQLKNVLAEASEDPDPLPALKDAGFTELQTFASWRRHLPVVPLREK